MLISTFDGNPCEWVLNVPSEGVPGPEAALNEMCRLNFTSGEPSDSPIGPMKFGKAPQIFWLAAGWSMGRQVWAFFMIFSMLQLTEEECEALMAEHCPKGLSGADDDDDDDDDDDVGVVYPLRPRP